MGNCGCAHSKPGFAPCMRSDCPCVASWNGLGGECCSKTCQGGKPCSVNRHTKPSSPDSSILSAVARCANPRCKCSASWNGSGGEFCCKKCRDGTPCSRNTHWKPTAPGATGTPAAPAVTPAPQDDSSPRLGYAGCARSDCSCTASWNGEEGEFCCQECKDGTPCSSITHARPRKPGVGIAGDFARCCRPGCKCGASWNGRPGQYCSLACRRGTPCGSNLHSCPEGRGDQRDGSKHPCAQCGAPSVQNQFWAFCGDACRRGYGGKPFAKQLSKEHYMFKGVQKQFDDDWDDAPSGFAKPAIEAVFKVFNPKSEQVYESMVASMRPAVTEVYQKDHHRGGKGCNQLRSFHGTYRECDFDGTPCSSAACSVCQILQHGFDLGRLRSGSGNPGFFGPGLYSTMKPATAFGYPTKVRDLRRKAILLVKVALGKYQLWETSAHTDQKPPAGCHSRVVHKTNPSTKREVDEEVVFDAAQMLLSYIILVKPADAP